MMSSSSGHSNTISDNYAVFSPNHNDIQEQSYANENHEAISAEASNKLLLMIRKQVIILIIGNIQNQTWRQKSQDIENAINSNINCVEYVNCYKLKLSTSERTLAVEQYLKDKKSVLIIDIGHENARYHWESLGERFNVPGFI